MNNEVRLCLDGSGSPRGCPCPSCVCDFGPAPPPRGLDLLWCPALPLLLPAPRLPQVWDFIYLGGEEPAGSPIPSDTLQASRLPQASTHNLRSPLHLPVA